jgi:hypothetical protein
VAEAVGSGLRTRPAARGALRGPAEMAVIDEAALTAAKIRDMPISAALRQVLLTAAHEAGVDTVRITSGGQPGSTGQRIGSNRHDGGNAADLELVARGRTLDFTRAADLGAICRFVASAAACGATGIGAGVNYMGPQRLHVGFGNGPNDTVQVVWGEGGRLGQRARLAARRGAARLGLRRRRSRSGRRRAAAAARSRGRTRGSAGRLRRLRRRARWAHRRAPCALRAPTARSAGWRAAPSLSFRSAADRQ